MWTSFETGTPLPRDIPRELENLAKDYRALGRSYTAHERKQICAAVHQVHRLILGCSCGAREEQSA